MLFQESAVVKLVKCAERPSASTTESLVPTLSQLRPAFGSGRRVTCFFGGRHGDVQLRWGMWESNFPTFARRQADGGSTFPTCAHSISVKGPQRRAKFILMVTSLIVVEELTCFYSSMVVCRVKCGVAHGDRYNLVLGAIRQGHLSDPCPPVC